MVPPARSLSVSNTRGHEAVPGSYVCASMKAGPGPCVPSHLLVARCVSLGRVRKRFPTETARGRGDHFSLQEPVDA